MPDCGRIEKILQKATSRVNQQVTRQLPLSDQSDFDAATKNRVGDVPENGIPGVNGRLAWNPAAYDFLSGECPQTVNPSLWRMAQLNQISGLFKVAEGVWQARGFDYANMTIIQGETGWILVDPMMTRQTSAAALKVVNESLGERPVSAVIITHTHPDHFGGSRGVIDADDPPPVYAPEGFMEFAASESILGGNHTSRRAIYQFGLTLDESPEGTVDGGIGKTVGKGERTFVKPSHFVGKTGEERLIDGVRFIFQMASGTEAPAEFTFLLPNHRVLCMAEVCTQTMHNILTPRGAQVRDALLWSRCIDEAISLFAESTDTLINCHNWPVWGAENVRTYLEEQRDIYKYTHDQTLRLANLGHTPFEIAEEICEPDWLSEKFHARGYYGTLKFNARAVYQYYYGNFDGNPVNLNPLSPQRHGEKFVAAVGGANAAIRIAEDAIEADDLQWAATVLNHLVFSAEANGDARRLLGLVYRHQGFREESGILRNIYLMGAKELEEGVKPLPALGGRNSDLAATLDIIDWFDAFALKLNPERARGHDLAINFRSAGRDVCLTVARQTEFARPDAQHSAPNATVEIDQQLLEQLADGVVTLEEAVTAGANISGDTAIVQAWLDLHDRFDLWFNIVTP